MRFAEDALSGGPVEAGVGNADAVFEFGAVFGNGLVAFLEIAFEHETDERLVAFGPLGDDAVGNLLLHAMLLQGIRVATIDHEDGVLAGFLEGSDSRGNAGGVVVGAGAAAAEDDVAERISLGADDRGKAVLVNAEKTVRGAGGVHRVEGDLETT